MSPRKGGGSSSGGSSSGSSGSSSSSSGTRFRGGRRYGNQCATLAGNTGTIYVSVFVIQGMCAIIIGLTGLLWLWFSLRKRRTAPSPVQSVLRFYSYGLLLLFLFLSTILSILRSALDLCYISTLLTSNSLFVASIIFGALAELLLLALISIIFVRYLLKIKARSTRLATIVNSAAFALVAILWLPLNVLYSYIVVRRVRYTIISSTYKLAAAYDFIYLLAAIAASVFIVSAILASAVPAFSTGCKLLTLFTLLMFCVHPLVLFIRDAAWAAADRPLSASGFAIFQVFESFSFVFAVLGLLLAVHTAKPRGAVAPATGTYKDDQVYAYEQNQQSTPQPPVYQQQQPQQQYQQYQQPVQQPIYQNQGVYSQGGGYGGSSLVFYNPPTAGRPHH